MMIFLASRAFDPDGHITINASPDSDVDGLTRRANRTATLDLGAVVNDRGFTHADRTFNIRWRTTEATREAVGHLVRTHSQVRVTTTEGAFDAVIQDYSAGAVESALNLLIESKVS